jgi:hypothetical protein
MLLTADLATLRREIEAAYSIDKSHQDGRMPTLQFKMNMNGCLQHLHKRMLHVMTKFYDAALKESSSDQEYDAPASRGATQGGRP